MKPRSLMSAYAEGSIVGRELRDMLANEAASARFDKELAMLDSHESTHPITGERYASAMRDFLEDAEAL